MQMALRDRIQAAVLCSAAGDAIGYRNGYWEFNYSGTDIHKQLHQKFRGLKGVYVG